MGVKSAIGASDGDSLAEGGASVGYSEGGEPVGKGVGSPAL